MKLRKIVLAAWTVGLSTLVAATPADARTVELLCWAGSDYCVKIELPF